MATRLLWQWLSVDTLCHKPYYCRRRRGRRAGERLNALGFAENPVKFRSAGYDFLYYKNRRLRAVQRRNGVLRRGKHNLVLTLDEGEAVMTVTRLVATDRLPT